MNRSPVYFAAPDGTVQNRTYGDRYPISTAWGQVSGHMAIARKYRESGNDEMRAVHMTLAHDLIDAIADAEGVGAKQQEADSPIQEIAA